MAAGVRDIKIRFSGDASGLERAAKTGETSLGRFSENAKKYAKRIAAGVAVLGAAAAVVGKQAIDIASDTEEALSKTRTVFGAGAKDIEKFAATSAKTFGISKREALTFTSAMGSVATAMGVPRQEATKLSLEYTKLSADLASFNNTSVEEAAEALKASVSGEYEQLKKFGIVVNDTTLAQEAQRLGMKKAGATWSQDQKLKLSNSIITRASADAQGDFARTSDGAANSQKILAARMEDLKGKIGKGLLPIWSRLLAAGLAFADWIERVSPQIQAFFQDMWKKWSPYVERARAAFDRIVEKIRGFIDSFRSGESETSGRVAKLQETFRQLWATIKTVFEGIRVTIQTVLKLVQAYWRTFGASITDFAKNTWDFVVGTIQNALKIIQGIVKTFTSILKGDWKGAWAGIKQTVSAAWDQIKTVIVFAVKGIADYLKDAGLALLRAAWDKIWGALKSATSAGIDRITALARTIIKPFTDAFAAIKRGWDNTVGRLKLPDLTPGFDVPGVPFLASGGTARAGRPHIVGERGPELFIPGRTGTVVPNDQLTGMGGGDYVIELHGDGLESVVERVVVRRDRATRGAVVAGSRRVA